MRGAAGSPEDLDMSDPPPIYSHSTLRTVGLRGGAMVPYKSPSKKSSSGKKTSPSKKTSTINEVPASQLVPTGAADAADVAVLAPAIGPSDNFNRERILKQRAAEIKIQKYDPWMAEQRRQDRLQRESYYTDHRAIVPGQKPEPPLFGMTRELMLSVSDALPTIYSQRLTPTDINAVLDENQNARNRILERMDVCVFCNQSFQKWKHHEMQAHLRKHADQIASAGKCPICATEQWAMMNMEQKKRHIAFHQKQRVVWEAEYCPICGEDFSRIGKQEDVIRHLAEHPPGMLRFCDKCGLEQSACSKSEIDNHKKKCIEAAERFEDDPVPRFCEICGTNRTEESEQGRIIHRMICNVDQRGYYCRKCGLNMNSMSVENRSRHVARCKPPRGLKGKHCQTCGEDQTGDSIEARKDHRKKCWLNIESERPSEQETIDGMSSSSHSENRYTNSPRRDEKGG